jgi:hypothetical protein
MSFRKPVRKEGPFRWIRSRKGRNIFVVVFTLVHILLTTLFFFWSFSAVMATTEGIDASSQSAKILVQISDFFTWPILFLLFQNTSLQNVLPNFTLYIAVFLNSLLWALAVLGLLLGLSEILRSRRRKR